MSNYPLPEPPSSLGFRSSTNTKDAQRIGIALGQYLPGAPLLSTWIEDYLRVLHCPKWKNGEEPLTFDAWFEMLDGQRLTARQHWVFEQCNMLRASDVFSSRRTVQEIVLVYGKGAGKGYIIAKLFSWLAYVMCSMAGDPAVHFDLAPESGLVMINAAPNEDLARNVFFKYLRRFLQNPLIQQFNPTVLADDVRFYREGKYGSYEFLSIYSRHSNASGLDGHNIVAFAGDEVDAFERTDTVCRATLIHDIFRSSASTRVKRGWIGAMFSYPRTEDGFMMKLYQRAINDMRENGPKATYFADLAATWDVRPDISRSTPTIVDDYKNDPKGAMARYECLPMAADDGFFEFDEYLGESVNLAKRPVARWREVMGTMETAKGTKSCVRAEVADITPEPGRNYFMGGDGSVSGDAFAISIWSTPAEREGSSDTSVTWVCPNCGKRKVLLSDRAYQQLPENSKWHAEKKHELVFCEMCGDTPQTASRTPDTLTCWVSRWWRAGVPSGINAVTGGSSEEMGSFSVNGKTFIVPRVREELIITWSPKRRSRPGERNVAVDLVNVEDVIRELIEKLYIRKAFFDPYQMAAIAQRLNGHHNCLVDTISFGQEAQYSRGRAIKSLLYSNVLELLPHYGVQDGSWSFDFGSGEWGHKGEAIRDREWRKLQRKGKRLDHPPQGSKDIWDAESIAIFTAITDWVGDISIEFAD